MDEAIEEALRAGNGVLAIGQHPALAWRVRRARERGELVAVLRGRYATPAAAASFAVRVLALLSLDPDAVLIGARPRANAISPRNRSRCLPFADGPRGN